MGSYYLTDLADVVRATGLTVQEEPGWQTRARGSGGYSSGLPNHVMLHHTASGPSSDGQPDVSYMCYSADARPIANLYLSRSGKVWIMAGGATNTNGSGGPIDNVPADNMNASAIGIEAGNNGTGEQWPQEQQEAYTKLAKALCDHYGIPTGHIRSHAEWAPGRKIDPAGPSRWTGTGTWNEDAFRGDVAAGWPGGSTPPTPERKVKMYSIVQCKEDGSCWASDMIHTRWLTTNDALAHYQSMLTLFGFNPNPNPATQAEVQQGKYGVPIGPLPWDGNRDATALALLYTPMGGYDQPNQPVWNHLLQTESAAKQAAGNTMPAGQSYTVPAEDAVPKSKKG